jgi:hypothetical protein
MSVVLLVLFWHLLQTLLRLYAYFRLNNTYRRTRYGHEYFEKGAQDVQRNVHGHIVYEGNDHPHGDPDGYPKRFVLRYESVVCRL